MSERRQMELGTHWSHRDSLGFLSRDNLDEVRNVNVFKEGLG